MTAAADSKQAKGRTLAKPFTPTSRVVPGIVVALTFACTPAVCAEDHATPPAPGRRIELVPVAGTMVCRVRWPGRPKEGFDLVVPESIGCAETTVLVNHPDVKSNPVKWETDNTDGSATATWEKPSVLGYTVKLIPQADHVDMVLTVVNRSPRRWQRVFMFNCLNPWDSSSLHDPEHARTFISVEGVPRRLCDLRKRVDPERPEVAWYVMPRVKGVPRLVRQWDAVCWDQPDSPWIAIVSADGNRYVAASAEGAKVLFTNQKNGCIHACPNFGEITPSESKTVVGRIYIGEGWIADFVERFNREQNPMRL